MFYYGKGVDRNYEEAITWKTRAVFVVHLYGQLVEMQGVHEVAKEHSLLVMEDAAQAHGAKNTLGKRAGNLSGAAAFSFYPTNEMKFSNC